MGGDVVVEGVESTVAAGTAGSDVVRYCVKWFLKLRSTEFLWGSRRCSCWFVGRCGGGT